MQTFKFIWYTNMNKDMGVDKLNLLEYQLVCDYKMNKDCLFEFSNKKEFPPTFNLELKIDYNQSDFEAGSLIYTGERLIPFGEITVQHINKTNHSLDEPHQNVQKIPVNGQTST